MTARSRDVAQRPGASIFGEELDERALQALAAETIRIMRRAALERALKVESRARRALDAHRHDTAPTLEREHRRALEAVRDAAALYAGIHDTEENDNG